jgi:tetratricopeptide (TPR) repeat protein
MLQNVLLLGEPEAPYSQAEALAQMREAYAFAASNGTTSTMRLVAEINLESLSPTWHRMSGLLNRLRAEQDFDSVLRGGDGASWLPLVLSVTRQHDLMRALAERHVANDPLAVNAWIRKAQAERHSGNFDAAKNVLAEARRIVGREPGYDFVEYNIARNEGNRDEAIVYLSGRRDPGATMFLLAVRGDYEAALRMADALESVPRSPTVRDAALVDVYFEAGATERLRALIKRIDDSPQGTAIFIQMLGQSAALAFDLADAPNFAARLIEAGVDPAAFAKMPRLSTLE